MADPKVDELEQGAEEGAQGTPDGTTPNESTFSDLIAEGLRAATPEQDEPDEQPDDEADEQDEAEDDSEGQPPAAEAKPALTPADWVTELRDRPHRINEIPAKERAGAIQQLISAERAAAVAAIGDAVAQREAEIKREQQIVAAVAEIDELRETSKDDFDAWATENPERASAYFAYKRDGGAAPKADPARDIAAAAAPLMERLKANPAAHAVIVAKDKADPKRYAPTPLGLANLAADVVEAMSQAKTPDPEDAAARKLLEKRRAQQEVRKDRPRIDVTEGRKGEPQLSNDPKELIAAGWRETRQNHR